MNAEAFLSPGGVAQGLQGISQAFSAMPGQIMEGKLRQAQLAARQQQIANEAAWRQQMVDVQNKRWDIMDQRYQGMNATAAKREEDQAALGVASKGGGQDVTTTSKDPDWTSAKPLGDFGEAGLAGAFGAKTDYQVGGQSRPDLKGVRDMAVQEQGRKSEMTDIAAENAKLRLLAQGHASDAAALRAKNESDRTRMGFITQKMKNFEPLAPEDEAFIQGLGQPAGGAAPAASPFQQAIQGAMRMAPGAPGAAPVAQPAGRPMVAPGGTSSAFMP